MTLQQKTIQRYRHFFPNETLRETSARTNIQITRIFRLFNGKKMKVVELERFEQIINQKIADNPSIQRLIKTMDEASLHLNNEELTKISDYIARKMYVRSLSKTYTNPVLDKKEIA
jgi:hypothetical protein